MKIKKIIRKVAERYTQFKNHPLTKDEALLALIRYVKFNALNFFNHKERVYKWVNGLKFYATKGEAGIVGNIYFKLFDYADSMLLLNRLKPGDVFVDVGANVGHFSLLAASKKAKVISIEPIPGTFDRLNKNIALNQLEDLITTKNIGIGDKEGTLFFTANKDVMNNVALNGTGNTIQVTVMTLDMAVNQADPKALKIDVEGYEYFVLAGATKTLSSPTLQYIIIELNDSSLKYNCTSEQIHNFILQYNFVPAKYTVALDKIIEEQGFNRRSFNTLYVKKELTESHG